MKSAQPMWQMRAADKGRSEVLAALRSDGGYVSGEQLSRRLGLSRNAIWKYVSSLRTYGYIIEASPRKGYCLVTTPDTPYSWEVSSLDGQRWLGGYSVYLPEVDSTNKLTKELARQGAPTGLCVVADKQTAGRGRRGRNWVSPPGSGLWFSLLLRPPMAPSEVPCFSLIAGAVVARAIRQVTGLPAMVKWPNDVLVHGGKVCGILIEMSAEVEHLNHLVVGIGVNVNLSANQWPAELRNVATSLSQESGTKVRRLPLLHAILQEMQQWYERLLSVGAGPLLEEAGELSATVGQQVKVVAVGQQPVCGLAVGIAADGALRVQISPGEERLFYAGDVSIR
jgi:BirA family biotin operon repressor/biotin-[acetyl-CoA-carboxylase] ligase